MCWLEQKGGRELERKRREVHETDDRRRASKRSRDREWIEERKEIVTETRIKVRKGEKKRLTNRETEKIDGRNREWKEERKRNLIEAKIEVRKGEKETEE